MESRQSGLGPAALLTAIVAAAIVTACGRSPSAPEVVVALSASPNPAVLRLGDTTRISVSVLNIGNRAIAIEASGCPWWFEVLKETAVVAPGVQWCAAISYPPRTVEPGASYTHVFTWRGERFQASEAPVPLGEGNYTLRPVVPVEGTMIRGTPVPFQIVR